MASVETEAELLEESYRMAAEDRCSLGALLLPDDKRKSLDAYREAAALDPYSVRAWGQIISLLAMVPSFAKDGDLDFAQGRFGEACTRAVRAANRNRRQDDRERILEDDLSEVTAERDALAAEVAALTVKLTGETSSTPPDGGCCGVHYSNGATVDLGQPHGVIDTDGNRTMVQDTADVCASCGSLYMPRDANGGS